jgi:hypothetical protein
MASASAGRGSGCACIRWSYSTQSGRPSYRTYEVTAFSIYYYPLVSLLMQYCAVPIREANETQNNRK